MQAWGHEGGLEGVWVSGPGALRKRREELADILWIGCKVWEFGISATGRWLPC